jgi:hypothetical protein
MTKNIFTYWEGAKPDYIKYCLNSIAEKSGADVFILDEKDIAQYLDKEELHENFFKIKHIAQRADYLRVALLEKHGGLWVDADTVFVKSADDFFKKVDGVDFAYIKWIDNLVINGYFYAEKNSEVLTQWKHDMDYILDKYEEKANYDWCFLGETILTPIIKSYLYPCEEVSRSTFVPVHFRHDYEVFFRDGNIKDYIKEDTVCVALNHSHFCGHHGNDFVCKNINEIKQRKDLVGQIFNL